MSACKDAAAAETWAGPDPANENIRSTGPTIINLTARVGRVAGRQLATVLARVLVAGTYAELGIVANDEE